MTATRFAPHLLSFAITFLATTAFAAAPTPKSSRLEGTWLFETATLKGRSHLSKVWTSKLTIKGDTFVLSNFLSLPTEIKGKFTLDPTAGSKKIDLVMEEGGLNVYGTLAKIPACTLHGIYAFDGGRLKVRFPLRPDAERPATFDSPGEDLASTTFRKAPAGFEDFPDAVTVGVKGVDGKPAAGVKVAVFMYSKAGRAERAAGRRWEYMRPAETGADGTVTSKYRDLRFSPAVAHDPKGGRMATVHLSPAGLASGKAGVVLKPACRLTGSIRCEEMKKLGGSIALAYVLADQDGRWVATCETADEKFELLLPPGRYQITAAGDNVGRKTLTVTVPEGKSEMALDPITLAASKFTLLSGRPAPELKGVLAWKGRQVKLADLKGKYVLLDFWGHMCVPCVEAMPVLIGLHERFHDKGLVVVGVHIDPEGEVDTPAKLDAKTAGFRKKIWGGKDLPFPNALVGGKAKTGVWADYGIESFPTAVLIDREGKVVGQFGTHDAKRAVEVVERLLGKK